MLEQVRPFYSGYRENEIINRVEYVLRHGEFKVYLQPRVELDDLGLIGAGTLMRRQHEDGRIIPSGELEMLWRMGCESDQGHYFSRPLLMNVLFERYCRKMVDKS